MSFSCYFLLLSNKRKEDRYHGKYAHFEAICQELVLGPDHYQGPNRNAGTMVSHFSIYTTGFHISTDVMCTVLLIWKQRLQLAASEHQLSREACKTIDQNLLSTLPQVIGIQTNNASPITKRLIFPCYNLQLYLHYMNIASPVFYLFYFSFSYTKQCINPCYTQAKKGRKKSSKKRRLEEEMHKCEH